MAGFKDDGILYLAFLTAGLEMVFRQRMQTGTLILFPLMVILTDAKLTPKVRLVCRLEWLTLWPTWRSLLQM